MHYVPGGFDQIELPSGRTCMTRLVPASTGELWVPRVGTGSRGKRMGSDVKTQHLSWTLTNKTRGGWR